MTAQIQGCSAGFSPDHVREAIRLEMEPMQADLNAIKKAIFVGNGKPPILSRLATLEESPRLASLETIIKIAGVVLTVLMVPTFGGVIYLAMHLPHS